MRSTLIAVLLIVGASLASRSDWNDEEIPINDAQTKTTAVYTTEDAPWGSGLPSVSIDVTFNNFNVTTSSQEKLLEVIVFHSDALDYMGFEVDGDKQYCCWADDVAEGRCTQPGRLYIDPEIFNANPYPVIHYQAIRFLANTTSSYTLQWNSNNDTYTPIQKSGVWRVWAYNCGSRDFSEEEDYKDSLFASGTVVIMNPYGHLPGSIAASLPLWWLLTIGYGLFGFVWMILLIVFRKDILVMQIAIFVVVILAFLESVVAAADYTTYNSRGDISVTYNVFSALLSTLKTTFALTTLLLISMGLSVYRTWIRKPIAVFVVCLTITFFILQGIYVMAWSLKYTPSAQDVLNISDTAITLLFLPALVMQFIYFLYIFFELWKSILLLKTQKQDAKRILFVRLAIILAVSYVLSFVFLCVQAGAEFTEGIANKWWRGWWIWDQWWPWLHLVLVFAIGILWRPNANNSRYAMAVELPTDDVKAPSRRATQPNASQPKQQQLEMDEKPTAKKIENEDDDNKRSDVESKQIEED